MKYTAFLSLIWWLLLFGCKSNVQSNTIKTDSGTRPVAPNKPVGNALKSADNAKAKEEIQTLIRQMLKWTDSEKEIDLLPALSKDTFALALIPLSCTRILRS